MNMNNNINLGSASFCNTFGLRKHIPCTACICDNVLIDLEHKNEYWQFCGYQCFAIKYDFI